MKIKSTYGSYTTEKKIYDLSMPPPSTISCEQRDVNKGK